MPHTFLRSLHRFQSTVCVASLSWLVIANSVGLLLSALLLYPELNNSLAPFTYGRWVTLHLDFQLYGWCALPLLGILCNWYLPISKTGFALLLLIFLLWSVALISGGYLWIHGETSGKLFLEWSGKLRLFFPEMLGVVWFLLAVGFIIRNKTNPVSKRHVTLLKIKFLLLLLVVPFIFWYATDRAVFPPINPESSGSTGTSLLASTLLIVALLLLIPPTFVTFHVPSIRTYIVSIGLLGFHFASLELLSRGNVDNRHASQFWGLASCLLWIPILYWYYTRFSWPKVAVPWLKCFGIWGSLLALNGVTMFVPGILERVKFTDMLVAHSHLAMAGMITSFNMLVLILMAPGSRLTHYLNQPRTRMVWNIGLLIMLSGLLFLGALEVAHPSYLYRSHPLIRAASALRFLGGCSMFLASAIWLCHALRPTAEHA